MDQTYLIKNIGEGNPRRHIFFRFGNWCYQGDLDLGFLNQLELGDLRIMMPILQRLQGQLHPHCEFYNTTRDSSSIQAIDTINQLVITLSDELSKLDEKVEKVIVNNDGDDDEVSTFFRIEVGEEFNLDIFSDYEIVISKNYFNYIVLHTILYGRTIFVALSDSSGSNQLLDTHFPNLKVNYETYNIEKYPPGHILKTVVLCFVKKANILESKFDDIATEESQSRFQTLGYNHIYLFMKNNRSKTNNLKELFFKFGDWCYHGCINFPFTDFNEEVLQIAFQILIPQKKNLHSICKYGQLPSESKYFPILKRFEGVCSFIEESFGLAESKLLSLQDSGKYSTVDWETAYFQFDTNQVNFPDTECIIAKMYLNESILYLYYYETTCIVSLIETSYDNALLDVNFPDIHKRKNDMEIIPLATFDSSKPFTKLSLWIPSTESQPDISSDDPTVVSSIPAQRKRVRDETTHRIAEVDSKLGPDSKSTDSPSSNSQSKLWLHTPSRIEPLPGRTDVNNRPDIFKNPFPGK